jgi:predicted nucleic acid-binding protein
MGTVSAVLGRTVYFDTNIFIFTVEGLPEVEDQTRSLLDALASNEITVVTSELTIAEVLVKPIRDGNTALQQTFEQLLHASPVFQVIPIQREILRAAAVLRATTKLKLLDAIHLATSDFIGRDSFLTGDLSFRSARAANIKILSELDLG